MSFPPPPNDATPPAAGGGFGPPQGFGPQQGYGPPAGAYPPAQSPYAPPQGGFAAPQGGYPQQGFHLPPPPPPPSGGNGPKIAAIFIAGVLVAGLAVGGFLLTRGGDDKEVAAGGEPSASASASPGTPGTPVAPESKAPAPTWSVPPAPTPSASSGRRVPLVHLKVGECFDHPTLTPTLERIATRSCTEAHDGEVIANKTLTGTFATEEQLRAKVLEMCKTESQQRMKTVPNDGTTYYSFALFPALDTYQGGESRISCSLTLSKGADGKKLTKALPGGATGA
ncbi:hypothetical protein [Streptomyces sp. URMC 123]|uniref:hypothetical protein n=1 Tax=Streptomyces sp. URMC 123 TaxID=3423403 RepID=UPI003F1AD667